ncbi:MAG TPA: DUF2249 domain-containing protein [Thermomicrobiales bacterium]|nr:DUF2249 domain-containing protein [Thermomicrobiales bacterium]
MTDKTAATVEVDVRNMVPRERHPLIFATIDELAAGETMLLINDHDPKPLYYQLMAERAGQVGWEYIENGPTVWQVQITKLG